MTSLEEFLATVKMERYFQVLKDYGVETIEHLLRFTPRDWEEVKLLPFHRDIIIHGTAQQKELNIIKMKQEVTQSN